MLNHHKARTIWQTKKLLEVCDLISRGISPNYTQGKGVVILNQKCIRNHEINLIPSRTHDSISKKVNIDKYIKLGDVLVNSTGVGTLGRVAQVRSELSNTTVDSHITIVRPQKGIFQGDFLGYILIKLEEEISKLGEGASGQIELPRKMLQNIEVSYPESIAEQRRIVKILDEAFATIAKAKDNTEKNLQNSYELFESYLQNIFVNDRKGLILHKLGDVSKVIAGQSPEGKSYNKLGNGLPFYQGKKDFDEKYIRKPTTWTTQVTKEALKNDILMSVRAPVGPINISTEKICIGRGLAAIRAGKEINLDFLYYNLLSKQSEIVGSAGAVFPSINKSEIENLKIYVPSIEEQKSIVAKLDALAGENKKLEAIYKQKLVLLEELKKSLLHQAFTGKL